MRFLVALALLAAISCSPSSSPLPTLDKPESDLRFTGSSLARLDGACGDAEPRRCVEVDLTWPVFSGSPASTVDALNRFATGQVTAAVTLGDGDFRDPETAAEDFVEAYLEFISDVPDSPQSWIARCHGDVRYQSSATVTLRFDADTYTGGAHGLQWATWASFDTATGQRLAFEDLVSDPEATTAIAERIFREANDLAPDDDLGEAGFWFDGNTFRLPEDIALTADGLVVYWPPYQIAPYALGPTEIVLPLTDLGELLIRE
jgi:hypothetical protein